MLNLTKGQPEELPTTHLAVGVAWKTSGGGRKGLRGLIQRAIGADLDACAVALQNGAPKRICWFDNPDAFENGSLVHDGDNRTGRGDGDDETLRANLPQIPAAIDTLVFIVSAYKEGTTFERIEGVTVSVYDTARGQTKIGEFMPDIDSRRNAVVAAKAQRQGDSWAVTVINEMGNARTRQGLLDLAKQHA